MTPDAAGSRPSAEEQALARPAFSCLRARRRKGKDAETGGRRPGRACVAGVLRESTLSAGGTPQLPSRSQRVRRHPDPQPTPSRPSHAAQRTSVPSRASPPSVPPFLPFPSVTSGAAQSSAEQRSERQRARLRRASHARPGLQAAGLGRPRHARRRAPAGRLQAAYGRVCMCADTCAHRTCMRQVEPCARLGEPASLPVRGETERKAKDVRRMHARKRAQVACRRSLRAASDETDMLQAHACTHARTHAHVTHPPLTTAARGHRFLAIAPLSALVAALPRAGARQLKLRARAKRKRCKRGKRCAVRWPLFRRRRNNARMHAVPCTQDGAASAAITLPAS